jgi:hypothetical protein
VLAETAPCRYLFDDSIAAYEEIAIEMLGKLAGFGVTEQHRIAERELDARPERDRRLHLAGALE